MGNVVSTLTTYEKQLIAAALDGELNNVISCVTHEVDVTVKACFDNDHGGNRTVLMCATERKQKIYL